MTNPRAAGMSASRHHPLALPPLEAAPALLGWELRHGACRARVVEVEAYLAQGDPACHTATRPSTRAFLEAHGPGAAYVYLNYGVHWLLNVVAGPPEAPGLLLLRAAEPLDGLAVMRRRRGRAARTAVDLCSGPGKLARAFGVGARHHGADLLASSGLHLAPPQTTHPTGTPVATTRIGISKAADLPWRFLLPENPHVSVRPGRS